MDFQLQDQNPHVSEKDVKLMHKGSVIFDLSIDHGRAVETCHPTSLDNPVFIKHNIVHYCVPNLPAAVPNSSSIALSQAVYPYIKRIADMGFEEIISVDPSLRAGLNLYKGKVVNKTLAESLGYEYYDILEFLELAL